MDSGYDGYACVDCTMKHLSAALVAADMVNSGFDRITNVRTVVGALIGQAHVLKDEIARTPEVYFNSEHVARLLGSLSLAEDFIVAGSGCWRDSDTARAGISRKLREMRKTYWETAVVSEEPGSFACDCEVFNVASRTDLFDDGLAVAPGAVAIKTWSNLLCAATHWSLLRYPYHTHSTAITSAIQCALDTKWQDAVLWIDEAVSVFWTQVFRPADSAAEGDNSGEEKEE